jgi:CHAT domain-containing protein
LERLRTLFEARFESEAELALGRTMTKAAFRERAPGVRFLHIATHGWFAPETVRSTLDPSDETGGTLWSRMDAREAVAGLAPMTLCGLAFAGANAGRDAVGHVPGILTAEELAGIDLSACELAVLSACETNVGIRRAGQGVQSLQAALHAAGVSTAITSLWKVDDAMTRRLMELFYTYLWVEELPKAEALWKAKCGLREEGAAVRDWAGWVLSGDPE